MAAPSQPFDAIVTALAIVAALGLGLSAGALLAEGAILVPYWKTLSPESFLDWYRSNAPLLYRFYSRLEIGAAVVAVVAAVTARLRRCPSGWAALAAALGIAVLAAFPLYFRDVNASFVEATIGLDQVAGELDRWAAWHWARTALGSAAFLAAVLGIRNLSTAS